VCDSWHWLPEAKYKRGAEKQTHVFLHDRWPGDAGIVYDVLSGFILYSDAFVETCMSGSFEGLGFERIGRWA
jgi:hypothetical protein